VPGFPRISGGRRQILVLLVFACSCRLSAPVAAIGAVRSGGLAGIASARQTFDSQFGIQAASYGPAKTTGYVQGAQPVTLQGLGFFDFPHGQHGVAPNGIELNPVISTVFDDQTTATWDQRQTK